MFTISSVSRIFFPAGGTESIEGAVMSPLHPSLPGCLRGELAEDEMAAAHLHSPCICWSLRYSECKERAGRLHSQPTLLVNVTRASWGWSDTQAPTLFQARKVQGEGGEVWAAHNWERAVPPSASPWIWAWFTFQEAEAEQFCCWSLIQSYHQKLSLHLHHFA